ncbi:thiamine phosphate synthase [Celerinatantimonas diazotrophica]|uniref:Thiamine-phosphate synthase n=1 Tax=Celerinatantimonas diazotrophica TaxID=412034 RepID=A0A4R1J7Z0_9GAMM|nr:thiamine phosphate synthase [Celerinatantimonas diazotrophica]TCK46642.1 thiamine-phosphate diphosphorylase [Celerinatantimonas diazotrophica]CAG9295344.1 Thiamine-phosphate synthase [Celerinatantimonas diazotrophica]
MNKQKPLMWIIAGQDSSGGAGIVADLLTTHDFDVTPSVVISALTAQNSQQLLGVEPCSVDFFKLQFDAIAMLQPCAIKVGMLANLEQVDVLTQTLHQLKRQQPDLKVVIDPVLVSSSGYNLGDVERVARFDRLFAEADLITPNIPELMTLTDTSIHSPEDLVKAAQQLAQRCQCAVLAKGGDSSFGERCVDVLCHFGSELVLSAPRIDTAHSHGTGCSLSSAIAAMLAHGYSLFDAVVAGKAYISRGLRLAVGQNSLPGAVAHWGRADQFADYPVIESSKTEIGRRYSALSNWPVAPQTAFARLDEQPGFYPLVDCFEWVEKLLHAGVRTLQLRIKEMAPAALKHCIFQSVQLAKQYRAQLFINDYWQLAIEAGAYGVHLGQEDIAANAVDLEAIARAGIRLGVSSHGEYELLRALALNPSYVAMGQVFATQSKVMPSAALGLTRFRQLCTLVDDCPIVAIGGIDLDNARPVIEAGADGLAVVSALSQSHAYLETIAKFNDIIGE